jgi:hypothetical protein
VGYLAKGELGGVAGAVLGALGGFAAEQVWNGVNFLGRDWQAALAGINSLRHPTPLDLYTVPEQNALIQGVAKNQPLNPLASSTILQSPISEPIQTVGGPELYTAAAGANLGSVLRGLELEGGYGVR